MVSIKWYIQNCHFVGTVPKFNRKTFLVPELQYNVVLTLTYNGVSRVVVKNSDSKGLYTV
jgi:hypothetical protein